MLRTGYVLRSSVRIDLTNGNGMNNSSERNNDLIQELLHRRLGQEFSCTECNERRARKSRRVEGWFWDLYRCENDEVGHTNRRQREKMERRTLAGRSLLKFQIWF